MIRNKHILSNYLVTEPHKDQKGTKMRLNEGQKQKIVNNDTNNAIEVFQLHQYALHVDM